VKYATPIIVARPAVTRPNHATAKAVSPRRRKSGDHLMILSTQASTSIEDVTAARGQPIWYQLYATNKFEVAKHHVQRAEKPAHWRSR